MLSDLIILAKADGKIALSEYDFLLRIADRMHISTEDLDFLLNHPIPSKPIFSEIDRITHFHKLVLLMNVDNETHPKEVITLKQFGLSLGIREEVIQKVLEKMENYEDKIIPPEELIRIFKTFYN